MESASGACPESTHVYDPGLRGFKPHLVPGCAEEAVGKRGILIHAVGFVRLEHLALLEKHPHLHADHGCDLPGTHKITQG